MGPNTSVYNSCAAKLNGEMFVFGGMGSSMEKQVKFCQNFVLVYSDIFSKNLNLRSVK